MSMIMAFVLACSTETPSLRFEVDPEQGGIVFLGWDTEGGDRAMRNLLYRPVMLYVDGAAVPEDPASVAYADTALPGDAQEATLVPLPVRCEEPGRAQLPAAVASGNDQPPGPAMTSAFESVVLHGSGAGWDVEWAVRAEGGSLHLRATCLEAPSRHDASLHLVFPFNPAVTPVTVLPSQWDGNGHFLLPAILSAPDHGQLLLASGEEMPVRGRLVGSRAAKTVDVHLLLPIRRPGDTCEFTFTPLYLPPPPGLVDTTWWRRARRGWFGAFQCSAEWGDPGHYYSAPAGMLANNVISDPASCSLWFYADQAFFTPELAPGISAMHLVRHTLDWWLDQKMLPHGEMICYWDKTDFLDANSGPIIAAWDYVEVTGDLTWLKERMERLERLAEFLAQRDIDSDGMVEAVQSGNYGALQQPGRSCAWWDALNCGHKDSYSNALIYRAWRCLADLEAKLGRTEAQARYTQLADGLHAAFFKTLYNPETGWLAWWKSEDGVLHDYASPVINGMAIEYGLVPPDQAGPMLDRLWNKMEEAGFARFDLGVPPMLTPVLRADYLLPDGIGIPQSADGSDTLGYYMNGGITAGQVLHFLAAHYVADKADKADRVLRAMLGRQAVGGFQNGAVNAYPKGIDWTTWEGQPSGYEGYLADSFRFLQAVLLREAPFRDRLYRPLKGRESVR